MFLHGTSMKKAFWVIKAGRKSQETTLPALPAFFLMGSRRSLASERHHEPLQNGKLLEDLRFLNLVGWISFSGAGDLVSPR